MRVRTRKLSAIGDVAGIKPGSRVRVSGKKEKSSGTAQFLVEKVSKDFGACSVSAP